MAAQEDIKIRLPVVPELDKQGVSNLIRAIDQLEKKLGQIDISFKKIAETSSLNIKGLKGISSAAASLAKNLSSAAEESVAELGSLMGELEEAKKKAADLKKEYRSAKGADKADIGKQLDETSNYIKGLNKMISDQRNNTKSLNAELNRVTQSSKKFSASLGKTASFAKDSWSKSSASVEKMFSGGLKNALSGTTDMFKTIQGALSKGKALKGGGGIPGMGGMGGAAKAGIGVAEMGGGAVAAEGGMAAAGGAAGGAGAGLMAIAGPLAIAAVAIAAFVKVLMMASESQTKLNKALIEGTGTANDFVSSAADYKGTIDDLRDAIQDSTGTLLKFGGTSEQTAKIINAFTKESTGSLSKTRNELSLLGGDLQTGVQEFAKAAMAYGKALAMPSEETAAMMGKFTSDLGYSTDHVVSQMGSIVQAAATANMPLTKFMSIFNSVIPDVELYQNRLEELTGTIKLLSKTMSAKDIKNFSDAFTKGFKGTDFKQRLKTVLVAGTANVSDALKADFDSKAKSMAQNFAEYAQPGEDLTQQFEDAMRGGTDTMATFLNTMQARASQKGKQLQGTQVSDAMKLAGYEAARQKGGPLNMATAMAGGGQMATYKILSKYGQTLTTGFDGLSEHVMKQLGITEQQYEALRTTAQTLKVQKDMLKTYGKTNSKSMNAALKQTIMMRKDRKKGDVTDEEMASATDDELFTAAEMSNNMKKDNEKVFDLASEQYNVTSSIGDKLDNVISYLLEQVLKLLNPLVDIANDILMWIISGDKKKLKATTDMIDQIKQQTKDTPGANEMVDTIGKAVAKGVGSGKTGKDLANSVAASGAFDVDSLGGLTTKDLIDFAQRTGGSSKDLLGAFQAAQKKGDVSAMLKSIDAMPGDMNDNLMKLTQLMAERGYVAQRYRDKAAGKTQYTRPGAGPALTAQQKKEQMTSGEAGDLEVLGPGGGTGAPVVAGGTGGGTGGPAGGLQATQAQAVDAQQQTAANTNAQANSQEAQAKIAEDSYQATSDVLSLLKKGIRFEQSWMTSKYQNVLYKSMQKALLEQLILQTQIKNDPKMEKAIGDWGWNIAAAGLDPLQLMLQHNKDDPSGAIADLLKPHATGISSVPYDSYMASLHRGERVLTANEVKGGAGGGGNKTTIVNIQATGVPASAIAHAISNISRSS